MAVPSEQMNGDGMGASVQGEDEILKSLSGLATFTRAERTAIVEAGAPLVEKHLHDTMDHTGKNGGPVWHEHKYPSDGKLFGKDIGHLMDNITHKPGQFKDGSTLIGFPKEVEPLAKWTNWGTYRQPGYNYFERSWNSMDTDRIFAEQGKVAKRLVEQKARKK